MEIIQCKLCHETKPLQRSHVIPNAVFRRVFRQNQGKAITFSDNNSSWNEYSSESWWEYLLCEECEKHLNRNYEQYSISLLRNSLKDAKILKVDEGVSFSHVDTVKLQLFIVSIIWRAAVSNLSEYSTVYLRQPWEDEIRNYLLKQKQIPSSLVDIKISRLCDNTPGGFSLENLKSLVVSPILRVNSKNVSFCLLIEGFFFEVFVPSLKLKEKNHSNIINPDTNSVFADYLNIFVCINGLQTI